MAMPWKDVKPMDEKLLFIADYKRQVSSFSQLCSQYGISRKTGYKWVERYQVGGFEALEAQSRRRHSHNERIPFAIEQMVIELRQSRGTPGPKKIQIQLLDQLNDEDIPSRTTIYNILKRANLIDSRRRKRRVRPNSGITHSANLPNELWSADYKGQFKLRDGQWCYPLTVMDNASRYLLGCQGLAGTRFEPTKKVFEKLFCEYGLPDRIRTDNGVPFASTGIGNLSRLSIWWIRLGIVPERIEPGQPQQNGRHERMHRTLKFSLDQPAAENMRKQQKQLDAFRQHYNELRPHESLGQKCPSSYYQTSGKAYPKRLPELEYPTWFMCAKVCSSGIVYRQNMMIYVGNVLKGEVIGMEAVGDGIWDVYFGPVKLGRFDESNAGKNNYLTLNV
jgi:putative transposase